MGPPDSEIPGPPPADVVAAKAEITRVVEAMAEFDEKDGLTNVQGGSNLLPSLEAARASVGPGTPTTFTLIDVRFINDHRARIAYDLHVGGRMNVNLGTQIGGAVLVDGQWKVARQTVVDLFARAGVTCPPSPGED